MQHVVKLPFQGQKLALGTNRSRMEDAFIQGESMYGEDHRTDDLQKSQEKQRQIAIQSKWCRF